MGTIVQIKLHCHFFVFRAIICSGDIAFLWGTIFSLISGRKTWSYSRPLALCMVIKEIPFLSFFMPAVFICVEDASSFFHREVARNHYVTEENLLEYYQDLPYMQQRLRDFLAGLKHAAAFRPYLATDYIRKRLEYDSYLYGKKEGQRTWMEIADYIQETQQGFLSFDEWKASMDALP